MYCKNCGKEVTNEEKICSKCGAKIESNENKVIAEEASTKNKSHIGLIVVIVFIVVIGGLCLISNSMWKSSGNHGKIEAAEDLKNITNNSTNNSTNDTNNNTTTNNNTNNTNTADNNITQTNTANLYEDEIKDKWNQTLPLNNTNGLECAVYNISGQELYLKYNLGICTVDKNDEVNRCMEGDLSYSLLQVKITIAQKGNSDYVYMTATEFENIIGNNNTTQNTQTSNNTSSIVGKHKIIYASGVDTSSISGYLELKADNTFKMYVGMPNMGVEFINIEGTYNISNDTIFINIKREGGYDLGSQARQDIIIIADDNLAYGSSYKFAK